MKYLFTFVVKRSTVTASRRLISTLMTLSIITAIIVTPQNPPCIEDIRRWPIDNRRGSRSLQDLVAIFQGHCRPLLSLKAGCIGNMGIIGYSAQELVAKVNGAVANG